MRLRTVSTAAMLFALTGMSHPARAATTVQRLKFSGSQAATSFLFDQAVTCSNGTPGTISGSGFASGAEQISTINGSPGLMIKLDLQPQCYSKAGGGVIRLALNSPKSDKIRYAYPGQ